MQTYCVILLYGGNHTTVLQIYDLALVVGIFASHGGTQLAPDNNQERSSLSTSKINETSFRL